MNYFNVRNLIDTIETDWKDILLSILNKNEELEKNINEMVGLDVKRFKVFPPQNLIFNAFNKFNVKELKVCIIGQDPYIKEGEAHGLSFSVPEGCKCPPSLRNIFKELQREFGVLRKNTDLTDWSKQGVLLLNTSLTVKEGTSESHMDIWSDFVVEIVKYMGKECKDICYLLWGNHAKAFGKLIDKNVNKILEWSHPSPLSRKNFDCDHFFKCNEYLTQKNKKEIKWV